MPQRMNERRSSSLEFCAREFVFLYDDVSSFFLSAMMRFLSFGTDIVCSRVIMTVDMKAWLIGFFPAKHETLVRWRETNKMFSRLRGVGVSSVNVKNKWG